ncbi:IclR family transcriptional regulator [Actinacidiphila yeochonensis]|uniref:IclR family transcriptional regulator n=1 Tax=Actinacidiphila yeochonensis TaxID=89050 RepID=UPI00099D7838|nr:IclR family transcriptional regulator [Actinacidiphila yeochonensis]
MSQTVDRALRILPLLAEGPAGLEQVAARLEVHKSTALRLLRTLREHGLVYRQQDQRYRLGARLFALAQQAVEALDIRETARPHLLDLNEETGHTVHLAVYEQGEVVYIDKVDSRYPVRMYSRIGRPVAITVAAVAKLLLADLPEPQRREAVARLEYPRYTPRSTPDAAAYLAELARVREQGWAEDRGGHEESINCVAAPVRGPDGRVWAALSLSAPDVVVTADELSRLRPLVQRTAEAVGRELCGADPRPPHQAGPPGPASPLSPVPAPSRALPSGRSAGLAPRPRRDARPARNLPAGSPAVPHSTSEDPPS